MLDFSTHAKQRPDTRIFAFGLGKTQNRVLHAAADFKALLGADYERRRAGAPISSFFGAETKLLLF